MRAGRFDEALAALERAAELQPTYQFPYWLLAIEYVRRVSATRRRCGTTSCWR